MVRGVNRSIIEVNNTGNKYFERVLFFVSPEYSSTDDGKLQKAATDYIKNADGQNFKRRTKKAKHNGRLIAAAICTVCAAAVCAVIILL